MIANSYCGYGKITEIIDKKWLFLSFTSLLLIVLYNIDLCLPHRTPINSFKLIQSVCIKEFEYFNEIILHCYSLKTTQKILLNIS